MFVLRALIISLSFIKIHVMHLIVATRESVPKHKIIKKEVEKQYFQILTLSEINDRSLTKYPRCHLLPTDEM